MTSLAMILLLALGATACDDTSEGLQQDAQDIQEGAEDALEEVE
jgi:predicted small secreted protein